MSPTMLHFCQGMDVAFDHRQDCPLCLCIVSYSYWRICICVFHFAIFVFVSAVGSVGAVRVGFIRPTHVWLKFFVAGCQVYSAFYDTAPARKLQRRPLSKTMAMATIIADNGNDYGSCLKCTSPSDPRHWWQDRVSSDIVLSGIYAIAIYWQQWRVAYLLEVCCSCPARPILSGSSNLFLLVIIWRADYWVGHSLSLRILFLEWQKDIFALWNGLWSLYQYGLFWR